MRYLLMWILVVFVSQAGDSLQRVVEPVVEIPQPAALKQDNHMFGYLTLGMSSIKTSKIGSLVLSLDTQDNQGFVGEIGLGYTIDTYFFTTLSLQRTALSNADIDNTYVSLNYQFSDLMLKPYVGAVLGYSRLKWSTIPYVVLVNQDLISESLTYGGQFGVEMGLNEDISFFAKYQYIVYDHELDIRNKTTLFRHDNAHNILMGVQYAF